MVWIEFVITSQCMTCVTTLIVIPYSIFKYTMCWTNCKMTPLAENVSFLSFICWNLTYSVGNAKYWSEISLTEHILHPFSHLVVIHVSIIQTLRKGDPFFKEKRSKNFIKLNAIFSIQLFLQHQLVKQLLKFLLNLST